MKTENFRETALENNKHLIKRMMDAYNGLDSEVENNLEDFQNGILSIDKEEVYDICTGTGGPASGFKVYARVYEDGTKEVHAATAYYQNWGTIKEETPLSDEETRALLSIVWIDGVSE